MGDGPADRRDADAASELTVEAPGADELVVVPWPLVIRTRVLARAEGRPSYPWIVLATTMFGLFSVGFTITVLSNALPRIADDLDASVSTLTWVLTGPLLAFAIIGPAAGKLGDLYGHRVVYAVSIGFVCVFAAATALAWSAGALIVFRLLGAATGAAAGPATLALINSLFPPARRAQAMGWWAMVIAGGPVVGVVAGGPVIEAFGWRWIFVAQVPLSFAGLLLALVLLPDTERRPRQPFDLAGTLTLVTGTTLVLLAVNRGPVWGWTSTGVVAAFVVAPIALVAFVAVERRTPHPLLPLRYLRRRNFAVPIAVQVFLNFAYMGGFIITPLLLQEQFGYGEAHTGWLLIARPLTFAVSAPVMGGLAVRIGERTSGVLGAVALVVSMVWLSTLAPGTSDLHVIGALALSGVAMGASSPALAATVANAVEDHDLGVAGATQQMLSQIGIVVGIQTMQTVQAARAASVGEVAAYGDAFLVGGGVAALGLVAALFVRSTRGAGPPGGEPRRAEGAPQGALATVGGAPASPTP